MAQLGLLTVLLFTLLMAIVFGARRLWKMVRFVREFITEIFITWIMLRSGEYHSTTHKNLRLHPYLCEVKHLDSVSLDEIYNFLISGFESKFSLEDARKVILSYSYVVLYRDKLDGSLRGVSHVGIYRKECYTLFRVGISMFKESYSGGPYMYAVLGYLSLKEWLSHPLMPMYLVTKVYGHKAYLVGMKFKNFYPRYECKTPKEIQEILDDFAISVQKPRETYDAIKNVVSAPENYSKLKKDLTTLTAGELENPHVKFFVENNPGWDKGDCLICGGLIDIKGILHCGIGVVFQKFCRAVRRRRKTAV